MQIMEVILSEKLLVYLETHGADTEIKYEEMIKNVVGHTEFIPLGLWVYGNFSDIFLILSRG